ncbi:MAG: hypothetical protein Q8K92_03465 [Leadbetterella sp.]|nr:hypothetical protein [Leadbetterella sp.]
MKYILALIPILALIFSGCDKTDPPVDNSPYWGTCSAIVNGENWEGDPVAGVNINHGNGVDLIIDSLDKYGIKRSVLGIMKVPLKIGTYPIVVTTPQVNDGKVGAINAPLEDDIVLGYYKVLELDSSSYITLTSYDSVSNEISGIFDITFLKEQGGSLYPDTLRFRDGQFHTKVK